MCTCFEFKMNILIHAHEELVCQLSELKLADYKIYGNIVKQIVLIELKQEFPIFRNPDFQKIC